MAKYKKCVFNQPCPKCEFCKIKWDSVSVCEKYHIVIGTETLRDAVKNRMQAIHAIQTEHEALSTRVSYAEERHLPEDQIRLCHIWENYLRLKLDVTPWLNGCTLEDTDREKLYRFLKRQTKRKTL